MGNKSIQSLHLDNKTIFTHFLDNDQTSHYHSIVYAIRQLTEEENNRYCLNRTRPSFTTPVKFTSKYALRIYQSGCFYLDSNHQWKSDGLRVRIRLNESFCSYAIFWIIGWIEDKSLSNALLCHSSDSICFCFCVFIAFNRLE